ncbi:MAG: pyridoxal phosphate-dependent aminotransferase family protein, partial [Gluconacetobacter diazotrophicus]|nr:pyridoxal phosphate-dependent aminotransferase family protein [Gluconacetobacter diazotrophicus]
AIHAVEHRPHLRRQLHDNAHRLHAGLNEAGFLLGPDASPIVSLALPSVEVAVAFWGRLLDAGVYVNLALPPATPGGRPLLRTSVSAAHTPAQIDLAAETITAIGRTLGVLTPDAAVA